MLLIPNLQLVKDVCHEVVAVIEHEAVGPLFKLLHRLPNGVVPIALLGIRKLILERVVSARLSEDSFVTVAVNEVRTSKVVLV